MSLHQSGKMLLALYDNGVLRLWNMQSARCTFKKKLGVVEKQDIVAKPDDVSEEENEDDEDEDVPIKEITREDLDEISRKPI